MFSFRPASAERVITPRMEIGNMTRPEIEDAVIGTMTYLVLS